MKTSGRFAQALSRLRARQGYPNAHAFYKARGGQRAFGLAFVNYLNLEQGASLPQGRRLEPLLSALGFGPESAEARELLLAYLEDLLGSDRLTASLRSLAPQDPVPASWRLAESAARQTIAARAVQLTLEQYKNLAEDANAYACHVLLVNTKGGLTRRRLGEETGLDAKAVDAALVRLRSVGLAKTTRAAARSPLAGKFVVPPAATPALAAVYAKLKAHRESWVEKNGRVVENRYLMLRAPKSKFAQYLPHLADVVSMSAIYGDVDPALGGEMYLVEGRVTRLFGRP